MEEPYQLLIDTWEGQLEIDEAVLKANGVAGMIIRLNDMNGGHHMDENFLSQWDQAKGLVRAPYFVYNPWVNGQANFTWLAEHMPADAKAVLVDVEVRYAGYSAKTYGSEFAKFYAMVRARWNCGIYTGEWFLDVLSTWPDADYWWAQYPYLLYPESRISLTWDELRDKLQMVVVPLNLNKIPGDLRMWQISGDKLILPGSNRQIDVNVFYGSLDELKQWLGYPIGETDPTPPPTEGETMQGYMCVETVNVRPLSDMNKVVAGLKVGDRIWGNSSIINGLARITFQKIYRATGKVDNWANCTAAVRDGSVVFLQPISDAEPGTGTPPPTTSKPVFNVTVEADGYSTVKVEMNPLP